MEMVKASVWNVKQTDLQENLSMPKVRPVITPMTTQVQKKATAKKTMMMSRNTQIDSV